MIITRAWDCGCQGWDVRNKANTKSAHARTLLGAILLYLTMRPWRRGQLPRGMEHCTILFKECEKGHGRLAATNWVDHGCPHCEIERLRLFLSEIAAMGPADEEWDADTLEGAVALAKRALLNEQVLMAKEG